MRRDSLERLLADGFALATSLVTATLTAHALGLDGKGYYATVTLLATLFVAAFEFGIERRAGRSRRPRQGEAG